MVNVCGGAQIIPVQLQGLRGVWGWLKRRHYGRSRRERRDFLNPAPPSGVSDRVRLSSELPCLPLAGSRPPSGRLWSGRRFHSDFKELRSQTLFGRRRLPTNSRVALLPPRIRGTPHCSKLDWPVFIASTFIVESGVNGFRGCDFLTSCKVTRFRRKISALAKRTSPFPAKKAAATDPPLIRR
jgi:hypothetical protein